jgi:hypothetical protein
MRFRFPAQTIVIPLSLVCTAVAFFPAWNHRNVHETSPIYDTKAAAEGWGKSEAQARHCLEWSTSIEAVSESGGWPTPESGPWFSTLRCNQKQIYMRMAGVFLGPWLVMNLVLIMFNILMPSTKMKH